MRILFVSPELTLNDYESAKKFLETCKSEVEKYILECSYIHNPEQIPSINRTLDKEMLMIIFNNNDNHCPDFINRLISKAKEKGSLIWFIAMDKEKRRPNRFVAESQSFDVWEQLRRRKFDDAYLNTIALLLARKIVSAALPTMYSEECLLFVSHKRIDGEELAAKLCDKLDVQSKTSRTFRDVVNVEVGDEAQSVIESALGISDVFIFLHTPQSGDSKWIEKEIRCALLNNIPILWINIDNANIDTLPVKPGDNPFFSYNSQDFEDDDKLTKIVDAILEQSFELIMANSVPLMDQITSFTDFCSSKNFEFIEVDKDQLIYNLKLPRIECCYPQTKMSHYIQYFGRRYHDQDLDQLRRFLDQKKYGEYQLYDSAILLSNNVKIKNYSKEIIEENCDDFYYNWKDYADGINSQYNNEIVISGAFPECEEIYKQSLIDAVSLFSKEILKNGFTLVFGSHPTFQELIFDISKKMRPKDFQKAIRMYISKYYEDQYNLSYLTNHASVCECKNIEDDQQKSLTETRTKMINRPNVKALICLGGKIRDHATSQGIDEEIRIAKANNIPIYLIGSVGGRSSQLAAEYKVSGKWSELNKAPAHLNEQLMFSFDYRKLINQVMNDLANH